MAKTTQPLSAAIDTAIVLVHADCSEDVTEKLTVLSQEGPDGFKMELPILSFPEQLITHDGYLASKILKYLKQKTGDVWFIFGTFRSQNGKRCYVVLERDQVPRLFAINRWEILEWTEKRIHQI